MRLRQLGKSGLLVAEFAFGAMPFGERGLIGSNAPWQDVGFADEQTAKQMIDLCFDEGINLIDML